MKKSITIVINGQEYHSVEEMPPEVRDQYRKSIASLRDSDGDGVPDILQNMGPSDIATESNIVREFITFNGKKYNSHEELPPEVRELIRRVPKLVEPGEDKASFEVGTTKLTTMLEDHRSSTNSSSGFTRILLWLLGTAVLVLLYFWLSGIKPSHLLGH
jgi:hypothetical protein